MNKTELEFLKELVKRVKSSDQKRLLKVIDNQEKGIKPIATFENGYGVRTQCPHCKSDIEDNYCCVCGTKIDWSDYE